MSVAKEPSVPKGTARSDFPPRDPQLFYELAKERLATQLEVIDAVDNKLGILVSVGSALMGILVAVLAVREAGPKATGLSAADYSVVGVSAFFYLVAATVSVYAYFSRDWDIGPDLGDIWSELWRGGDEYLLRWEVANDFWSYYKANLKAQTRKSELLPWALIAVICQTLTLVAALVLVASGA